MVKQDSYTYLTGMSGGKCEPFLRCLHTSCTATLNIVTYLIQTGDVKLRDTNKDYTQTCGLFSLSSKAFSIFQLKVMTYTNEIWVTSIKVMTSKLMHCEYLIIDFRHRNLKMHKFLLYNLLKPSIT